MELVKNKQLVCLALEIYALVAEAAGHLIKHKQKLEAEEPEETELLRWPQMQQAVTTMEENLILDMLAEDMEAEVAAVLLVAQAHKASSSSVMLVNFDKEE